MKTRIVSALVMVPLLLVVYFGGIPLAAACFLVGLIGVRELFKGFEAMDVHPCYPVAYGALILLYGLHFLFPLEHEYLTGWLVLGVMASAIYIFRINEHKIEDATATMLGIVYVIFFSYHVVMTDMTGEYRILTWMIFITAFVTDICAYFSGYFLGKHKLCPNLSPKKTIEGAVGGVLGTVIVSGIFGAVFLKGMVVHCLLMGLIGSVLSMCGDLTASAFKRKMGIKDYGNLIPGHGGILDRFDSVLFTAPAIYYYIQIVLMR